MRHCPFVDVRFLVVHLSLRLVLLKQDYEVGPFDLKDRVVFPLTSHKLLKNAELLVRILIVLQKSFKLTIGEKLGYQLVVSKVLIVCDDVTFVSSPKS